MARNSWVTLNGNWIASRNNCSGGIQVRRDG